VGLIAIVSPECDHPWCGVLKGLLALARNSIRGRVVDAVFEFGIADHSSVIPNLKIDVAHPAEPPPNPPILAAVYTQLDRRSFGSCRPLNPSNSIGKFLEARKIARLRHLPILPESIACVYTVANSGRLLSQDGLKSPRIGGFRGPSIVATIV
jgi:hypothetical protein